MRLPDTNSRVPDNTSEEINRRIEEASQRSILYHLNHPDKIPFRLKELDREWDIERALGANAASIIIITSILGFAYTTLFFIIPLLVGVFLLQHSLQGWCPPLPILRRLGFRTSSEIAYEREAIESIAGNMNR